MNKPRSPALNPLPEDAATVQEFENLLSYLKVSRGFDFTAYKRSSLMRRTLVRMQNIRVSGFANYQDYLQVDPEEFTRLFNTILINVTGFFRDPPAWEYLAGNVLPDMLGSPQATHPVRIWSAGCASGEEAYSIAMLLAEQLGGEQFRERVKIYATDVDEEALNEARTASYEERSTKDVPPALLSKYFEQQNGRFIINKELRRSVIFGRHDLIQDAPISRVNLLICRNCMMYFNAETQGRILSRFRFALLPGGVLFLGRAETLLSRTNAFAPIDVKRRIFVKQDRNVQGERLAEAFREENGGGTSSRLRNAAADLGPVARLVVDREGIVLQASQQLVDGDLQVRKWNSRAADMWGLRSDEAVHKNFLNLDIGIPSDQLKAPLRNSLAGEHQEVVLDATNRKGKAVRLKVTCTPLVSPTKQAVSGVILVMEPVDGRVLAPDQQRMI